MNKILLLSAKISIAYTADATCANLDWQGDKRENTGRMNTPFNTGYAGWTTREPIGIGKSEWYYGNPFKGSDHACDPPRCSISGDGLENTIKLEYTYIDKMVYGWKFAVRKNVSGGYSEKTAIITCKQKDMDANLDDVIIKYSQLANPNQCLNALSLANTQPSTIDVAYQSGNLGSLDSFDWSTAFTNSEAPDCPVTYTVKSGNFGDVINGIGMDSNDKTKLRLQTDVSVGYSEQIYVIADNGKQNALWAKTTINQASRCIAAGVLTANAGQPATIDNVYAQANHYHSLDSFDWSTAFTNTESPACPVTYTVKAGNCVDRAPLGIIFDSSDVTQLRLPTSIPAGHSSQICVIASNGDQQVTATTTINQASRCIAASVLTPNNSHPRQIKGPYKVSVASIDSFDWSTAFTNTESLECPVTYQVYGSDCSSRAPFYIDFDRTEVTKLRITAMQRTGYTADICVVADNGDQTAHALATVVQIEQGSAVVVVILVVLAITGIVAGAAWKYKQDQSDAQNDQRVQQEKTQGDARAQEVQLADNGGDTDRPMVKVKFEGKVGEDIVDMEADK